MGDKFGLNTPVDRIISEAHERGLEILLLGDQEAASLRKKIVAIEKEKVDEEVSYLIIVVCSEEKAVGC